MHLNTSNPIIQEQSELDNLVNSIATSKTVTITENDDVALSTTGNECLNFFARITRGAPISDYLQLFDSSWTEDPKTIIKILMNLRDVRSGKGEKLIPVVMLVHIKLIYPQEIYNSIIKKMIEYGYWKDLLKILEIEARYYKEMKMKPSTINEIEITLFADQLAKDYKLLQTPNPTNKKPAISLCAKWAPSLKTHYNHHPMFVADKIMVAMNLNKKDYRVMLTNLRKHLKTLETMMCQNLYDQIDFSCLPSVAMKKMAPSFRRTTNAKGIESDGRIKLHESYATYLTKLKEGKTTVNVKAVHPHEIVAVYLSDSSEEVDPLLEAQWDTIKQDLMRSGTFESVTAIVDVSGSMYMDSYGGNEPYRVAIALGILVAECTKGPYHGKVITFHTEPSWHELVGENLKEKIKCIQSAPVGQSTNLRATFDMILADAQAAQLEKNQMVEKLFIFTDMQFNACDQQNSFESTFEYAKRIYYEAGYDLPKIICWNLRTSDTKSLPVSQHEEGFVMLSGFSMELLKSIFTTQEFSPYAMMMHVLDPYDVPSEISTCQCKTIKLPQTHLDNLGVAIKKSEFKIVPNPHSKNQPTVPTDSNENTMGTDNARGLSNNKPFLRNENTIDSKWGNPVAEWAAAAVDFTKEDNALNNLEWGNPIQEWNVVDADNAKDTAVDSPIQGWDNPIQECDNPIQERNVVAVDNPTDTGVDNPIDTAVDNPKDTAVDNPTDTCVDNPTDTATDNKSEWEK